MLIDKYLNYGTFIKGWYLLKCLEDDEYRGVNMGQWIISYETFVEEDKPRLIPLFILDDVPSFDIEDEDDVEPSIKKMESFEKSFLSDPQVGYGLYNNCIYDGFDPSFDDLYIWLAERINNCIDDAQKRMPKKMLKRMLDMYVAIEEYEKAALIRDVMRKKTTNKAV